MDPDRYAAALRAANGDRGTLKDWTTLMMIQSVNDNKTDTVETTDSIWKKVMSFSDEYAKSADSRTMLIAICAVETLRQTNYNGQTTVPLESVTSTTDLCLRHCDSSKNPNFQDFDKIMFATGENESVSQTIRERAEKLLTAWMQKLPLSAAGTAAYRRMLEILNYFSTKCLTLSPTVLESAMVNLLHTDPYRCSLLQLHVGRKIFHSLVSAFFRKRTSSYLPAEEALQILKQLSTMGGDEELEMERHSSVVGWWTCSDDTLHIEATNRGIIITHRGYPDRVICTGLLQLTNGSNGSTTGVPGCSFLNSSPTFSCLIEGFTSAEAAALNKSASGHFSNKDGMESPRGGINRHSSLKGSAMSSSFTAGDAGASSELVVRPVRKYIWIEIDPQNPSLLTVYIQSAEEAESSSGNAPKHFVYHKDPIASENRVSQMLRVLESILKSPLSLRHPATRFEDDLFSVFTSVPEVVVGFLRQLTTISDDLNPHGDEQGQSELVPVNYNPESLSVFFHAACRVDERKRRRLFDMYFPRMAEAKQFPSLLSTAGSIICCGMQSEPKSNQAKLVISLARRLVQSNPLTPTDGCLPIQILASITSTYRNEYDGCWSLQCTESSTILTDCITISGMLVWVNAPLLGASSCTPQFQYTDSSLLIFLDNYQSRVLELTSFYNTQTVLTRRRSSGSRKFTVSEESPPCVVVNGLLNDKKCILLRESQRKATSIKQKPFIGWRHTALQYCAMELETLVSTCDAGYARHRGRGNVLDVIKQIFVRSGDRSPQDVFIIRLWGICCQQFVAPTGQQSPSSCQHLDDFILTPISELLHESTNSQLRLNSGSAQREAYQTALSAYFSIRPISWCDLPVQNSLLKILVNEGYEGSLGFLQASEKAFSTFQEKLDSYQVDVQTYERITGKPEYRKTHILNGLVFSDVGCDNDKFMDAYKSSMSKLQNVYTTLSLLIETWGLAGASELQERIATVLNDHTATKLCVMIQIVEDASNKLGILLTEREVASSLVVTALIRKREVVHIEGLNDTLNEIRDEIRSMRMTDSVAKCFPIAGINGSDGSLFDIKNRKIDSEIRLLTNFGCNPEVATSLVSAGIPLSIIPISLWNNFGKLIQDPDSPELVLSDDFFTSDEEDILFNTHKRLDQIPMSQASETLQKIYDICTEEGCQFTPLTILKAVISCPELIQFTRMSPEAQDVGLSDVLGNSKDVEHAHFQSFVNNIAYLNPFVRSTAPYKAGYTATRQQLAPLRCREFWKELGSSVSHEGRESVDIESVCRNIRKLSTKDEIMALEKILRQQHGTIDILIEICAAAKTITINLPGTGQPSFECRIHLPSETIVKTETAYQSLLHRATLQRDVCPDTLTVFIKEARNVLRVFSLCAFLYTEGHVEFRSRSVRFAHEQAPTLVKLLSPLRGMWGTSVFVTACKNYSELSRITSSQVLRMTDLMRQQSPNGVSYEDEQVSLTNCWRKSRLEDKVAGVGLESIEGVGGSIPEIEPRMTKCARRENTSGTASTPERHQSLRDSLSSVTIEGSDEISGVYTESLGCYKRIDDDAAAYPVSGGWVFYNSNGERVLSSVSSHQETLKPWELTDWVIDGDDKPSTKRLVRPDADHDMSTVESTDVSTREVNITVDAKELFAKGKSRGLLQTSVVAQQAVYVTHVEEFTVWESLGFESGMRIISLNNKRLSPSAMKEGIEAAIEGGQTFAVTAIHSWVWNVLSPDLLLSSSGKTVRRVRTSESTCMAVSPALGDTFQIKTHGEVLGMRIGITTRSLDVNLPADTGTNKPLAYWYLRCGRIRHNGQDIHKARSYNSGDVITVMSCVCESDSNIRLLYFFVNGIPATRDHEPVQIPLSRNIESFRPVIYIPSTGGAATLRCGAPFHFPFDISSKNPFTWSPTRNLVCTVSESLASVTRSSNASAPSYCVGNYMMTGPGPHRFEMCVVGNDFLENVYCGVASPVVPFSANGAAGKLFALTVRPDGCVFLDNTSKNVHREPNLRAPKNLGKVTLSFEVDLGEGTVQVARDGVRILHTGCHASKFPRASGPLVPYVILTSGFATVTLQPPEPPTPPSPTNEPSLIVKGARPDIDGLYSWYSSTYKYSPQIDFEDHPFKLASGLHIYYWLARRRWCLADFAERPLAWSTSNSPSKLSKAVNLWSLVVEPSVYSPPEHLLFEKNGVTIINFNLTNTAGDRPTYKSINDNDKILFLRYSTVVGRWLITSEESPNDISAMYCSGVSKVLPHQVDCWMVGDGLQFIEDGRYSVVRPRVESGAKIKKTSFRFSTTISTVTEVMTTSELVGWHIVKLATGVAASPHDLRVAISEISSMMHSKFELPWQDWLTPEDAISQVSKSAFHLLECVGMVFRKIANCSPAIPSNLPMPDGFRKLKGKSVGSTVVDVSKLSKTDQILVTLSLFEPGQDRSHCVLYCTTSTSLEDVTGFLLLHQLSEKGLMVVINIQLLNSHLQNTIRVAAESSKQNPEKQLFAIITDGEGTDEAVEHLDYQCCNISWKKWAMQHASSISLFASITHFNQPAGTGKSYSIEHLVMTNYWNFPRPPPTPVRLDLDSTVTDVASVCKKLLAPLREPTGILIINVAHDTLLDIFNVVLDSLIFIGKLQSPCGMSVTVPPNAWHLVVEFQEGWDNTDVAILSCSQLSTLGSLLPFNIADVAGAAAALQFLRLMLPGMPREDIVLAQMLSSGEQDPSLFRDTNASGKTVSARTMTRSLRFLSRQYSIFNPSSSKLNLPMHKLVALCLIHEMHFFVNSWGDDNTHVVLAEDRIKMYMQLSGSPSPELRRAMNEHSEDIRFYQVMMKNGNSDRPQDSEKAAFDNTSACSIISVLADEIAVRPKLVAAVIAEKGYVLIPDFLHKLVQLSLHLDLQDPAILQGPSGTGKTFAVELLCTCMQQPSVNNPADAKRRKGFSDLASSLVKFFVRDPELKSLFPNNQSEAIVADKRILWGASSRRDTESAGTCIAKLMSVGDADALNFLKNRIFDMVAPLLHGSEEVAALCAKPDSPFSANISIISNPLPNPDCKEVGQALLDIIYEMSMVGAGYLITHLALGTTAALKSDELKAILGYTPHAYSEFIKVLNQNHKLEAFKIWAREGVKNTRTNKLAFCSIVKKRLREELQTSALSDISNDLKRDLADPDNTNMTGEKLGDLICKVVELDKQPATLSVLMRYDLTAQQLFEKLLPMLERATAAPDIQFVVIIDELNATKMLGLMKRIIVDKRWNLWEEAHPESEGILPANITIIGCVNPSDAERDVGSEPGFDVTPMPKALTGFVIPWRQLESNQRDLFVQRLIANNKYVYSGGIPESIISLLVKILLTVHGFAEKKGSEKGVRFAVSQRDLHRVLKCFSYFCKQGKKYATPTGVHNHDLAISSLMLGAAVSYYFRYTQSERSELCSCVNAISPLNLSLTETIDAAIDHYCDPRHLRLPDAVYAHQGLLQNIFVQIICFELRIAVILQGPPGTSKTLSNAIIRDNMNGSAPFWNKLCSISDVCRYQGTSQSTAVEIHRKCEEALQKQRENDQAGMSHRRTLLFVDEAGLVKGVDNAQSPGGVKKYPLKTLHYYLEAGLATVLMTNTSLDPAVTNRCIVVNIEEPSEDELTAMCYGILHRRKCSGLSSHTKQVVALCCKAFLKLHKSEDASIRWWFGLRDLFHLIRYIRRRGVTSSSVVTLTPSLLMEALERNFNGPPELAGAALRAFADCLSAFDSSFSLQNLQKHARNTINILLDSLSDVAHAAPEFGHTNSNDTWVRFKLVVDGTGDGSLLQLLQQKKEFQEHNAVLSLSEFSKDDLLPAMVVSQITAAMESGSTVWLTNTRAIDGSLFDVFNQNYVVTSNASGEEIFFVAVAMGSSLEYKRVHPGFQCLVHVTKHDLNPQMLSSPFLNRLEKFYVTVSDVLQHTISMMSDTDQMLTHQLQTHLQKFEDVLSVRTRGIFSDSPKDTIASLVLLSVGYAADVNSPPVISGVEIDNRILSDCGLSEFLRDIDSGDRFKSMWRQLSCKVLQIMQPESVILAQKVLVSGAPAFLRSFFIDLSPCSLSDFCKHTCETARPENPCKKVIVYSPATVDFHTLLVKVEGVQVCSVDSLLVSERGLDELHTMIESFVSDVNKTCLCVIVSPGSLGSPASTEIRRELEAYTSTAPGKAFIIIQSFRKHNITTKCNCTPLFGGWDIYYIDASAEIQNQNILCYIEPKIAGLQIRSPPQWSHLEQLFDSALGTLMQTQGEGQTRWAAVPPSDPAFALYDSRQSLSEQIVCLKLVLDRIPLLRQTLLELYLQRLPKPSELRNMAKDVVSHDNGQVSLAQRLLDEENKALRALVSITIRLLVDNRNASSLLSFSIDDPKLQKCDKLLSLLLQLQTANYTFDQLRRHKVNTKRTIVVGPQPPVLPGLFAIIELVQADPSNDCIEEAERLAQLHSGTRIEEISNFIVANNLQYDLLQDCVRGKVHFTDLTLTKHIVHWVYHLTKAHHAHIFENKTPTVWSILSLCAVEAAVIDNYILAMLPLASMGALQKVDSEYISDMLKEYGPTWVSYELGPKLLLDSLPQMSFSSDSVKQFKVACSGVLHRMGSAWMNTSDTLPCIAILNAVLTSSERLSVPSILNFAKACRVIGEKNKLSQKDQLPIDLTALNSLLKVMASSTSKVALVLAKIYSLSSKDSSEALMKTILGLLRHKEITRPMCARIVGKMMTSPDEMFAQHHENLCDLFLSAAQTDVPTVKTGPIPQSYQPPSSLAGGTAHPDTNSPFDSKVYLALYDSSYDFFMSSDVSVSLCKKLIAAIHKRTSYEQEHQSQPSKLAASATVRKAAEVAFVRSLAVLFHKPRGTSPNVVWEPVFCGDPTLMKSFSEMAKQLMDQPATSKSPTGTPVKLKLDPHIQDNIMLFIDALESGVGSIRGLGTASMLAYLRESSNNEDSALVRVCGRCIHLKCKDSEELSIRPGDLPFLYRTTDPLYEPFHRFAALLRQSSDLTSSAECLKKIVDYVRSLKKTLPDGKVILIVIYAAFRFFFGRKEIHIMSEKLTCQLARELKLGDRRSRILLVALDRRKSQAYSNKQVNMTDSLMEGFANEWTELVCTALCVACACPDSFIGSCFLDIDSQRGCFLPGDKTGGPLERGGNYKLDCVTQLDEEGNIVEYSRGQEILSTGACYLLWGVLFTGLAIQLNLFPDTFETVWHWMVSPILKARTLGYQLGTSDYRHLVNQLTERAIAYNLHMGSHTGLSVDEARKLYALFLYSLVNSPGALEIKQHKTRGSALLAEASAEEFWKTYTSTHRKTLSRSESELCSTLRSLLAWRDTHYLDLPRPDTLYQRLECLPSNKSPRLVAMMVYEQKKLVILAPLIIDLCSFVGIVQRCLSNRLPLHQLINGEERFTAYSGVLQLLKDHAASKDYAQAKVMLQSIKQSWNQYIRTVGPIDYECQEGGINIYMDTEELPDDPDAGSSGRIGAAGLPDTLDFWITTSGSVDTKHCNLVKEAIQSLIQKYNKCQSVVEAHTRFSMEDVDPSILNPSKPDLILRECKNVVEIYRSHAQASGQVNWDAIENEIALSSGLILPKMLMPILPCFTFTSQPSHTVTSDAEHLALELLDTHVDRFATPLTEEALQTLRSGVKEFSEERTTETLACLARMFNSCSQPEVTPFYEVFVQCWQAGDSTKPVPLTEKSLTDVQVQHTAAVMKLFLEKIEFCDWLLPHIGGYAGRISTERLKEIEDKLELYMKDTTPEKVLEELGSIIEVACDLVMSGMQLTGDQDLTSLIAGILMDGENSLCLRVYQPVYVRHIASFIREVKLLHRKLHALTTSKSWFESSAILTEAPHLLPNPKDIEVGDDLVVKASSSELVSPGMQIVSVQRTRVRTLEEYTQRVGDVKGVVELGILITDGA